jgi:PTH2 family peptidyl-tRNA hydrolase
VSEPAYAKQVIVMRKDLNMRKGKMIAQGAHASLAVVLQAGAVDAADPARYTLAMSEPMRAWLTGRFTKVCVSVTSEAELDDVVARARAAGVPCALITDSGATEFHGVPTKTCCAVGPAWIADVDAITGALPLL